MKRRIRLTETDLHRIVKQVINEALVNNPPQLHYKEAISQLESGLRSALDAHQRMLGEFPQEAIDSAQENDGFNLYEYWKYIEGDIHHSLELLHGIKYYLDIPNN